jgi:tRNA (guanosine-2'-O-)-methyltransferase
MGATKWIDMYKYNDDENNTINCINKLKQKGYKIVATTPHGNQFSLYDLPLDKPIALFFGTEKRIKIPFRRKRTMYSRYRTK